LVGLASRDGKCRAHRRSPRSRIRASSSARAGLPRY
jgi:hypothetical protein